MHVSASNFQRRIPTNVLRNMTGYKMHKNSFKAILLAGLFVIGAMNSIASAQVTITIAPPLLPMYAQPPIPADGYMWTPGYWSWDSTNNDYFWVPGTWVIAPFVGALWTPGYWSFEDEGYTWHRGYWGSHVGYYGGISYGFGYVGNGYQGGYWNNGAFRYNSTVNNIGKSTISNRYSSKIEHQDRANRASFNGGNGGIHSHPTKNEQIINSMPHNQPTTEQAHHENVAHDNTDQRFSVNHGQPHIAATSQTGNFNIGRTESSRAVTQQASHRPVEPNAQKPRSIHLANPIRTTNPVMHQSGPRQPVPQQPVPQQRVPQQPVPQQHTPQPRPAQQQDKPAHQSRPAQQQEEHR